jgi:SRSO17 transposase
LSNAAPDTPTLRLAQMQGHRYWVERIFEDAKGERGLGDYQALGWQAWHHHVTMVMLAMLFIAAAQTRRQRRAGAPINERHQRRLGAIQSRFRAAAKSQPS